jgi:hypothetical protein
VQRGGHYQTLAGLRRLHIEPRQRSEHLPVGLRAVDHDHIAEPSISAEALHFDELRQFLVVAHMQAADRAILGDLPPQEPALREDRHVDLPSVLAQRRSVLHFFHQHDCFPSCGVRT